MKKQIRLGAAVAAIIGFVMTTRAQDTNLDQPQYPTILQQPVDQCLALGSPVTFTVVAINADGYQWYDNNVAMDGQTNSTLTISNAAISDVGNYVVAVIRGEDWIPSRAAGLNVYTISRPVSNLLATTTSFGNRLLSTATSSLLSPLAMGDGSSMTIYSMPVQSSGSSGTCPGSYSGYVNFTKTAGQGWGWGPSTNALVVSVEDQNRTNTVVVVTGKNFDNYCSPTSTFVSLPTPSAKYRFAIYFAHGTQVPTNTYSITVTGFDP